MNIWIFCSHYTLRSVKNTTQNFSTKIPWIDFEHTEKNRPTKPGQHRKCPLRERRRGKRRRTTLGIFWGIPSLKLTWHSSPLKTRGISEGKGGKDHIPSIHFQVRADLLVSGKVILDIPDAIVFSFGGKGSFILPCVKALILLMVVRYIRMCRYAKVLKVSDFSTYPHPKPPAPKPTHLPLVEDGVFSLPM